MEGSGATVGILSIGQMGLGVARLLIEHGYKVVTNASDRSESTQNRARSASIELLNTDLGLVEKSDYILSIVPPRDALHTAQRISKALSEAKREQPNPLYFLDLNAVSPLTSKSIVDAFQHVPSNLYRVIDGGILGGPPRLLSSNDDKEQSWYKPAIVISGPHELSSAPVDGSHLASILNLKHIHSEIGPASGLKMCFAAINKGLLSIAIQSYTTADQLGILPELQSQLKTSNNRLSDVIENGVGRVPPKAYRWVEEMEQIADTFELYGGFSDSGRSGKGKGGGLFRNVSDMYKFMADETELGEEKTDDRKIGTNAKEVANVLSKRLEPRYKIKTD